MAENHKLWGGRFEASLEKWVEEFGASISFDQKMAEFDLKGSIAHVTMLKIFLNDKITFRPFLILPTQVNSQVNHPFDK